MGAEQILEAIKVQLRLDREFAPYADELLRFITAAEREADARATQRISPSPEEHG